VAAAAGKGDHSAHELLHAVTVTLACHMRGLLSPVELCRYPMTARHGMCGTVHSEQAKSAPAVWSAPGAVYNSLRKQVASTSNPRAMQQNTLQHAQCARPFKP
jgi:hypothetical protein